MESLDRQSPAAALPLSDEEEAVLRSIDQDWLLARLSRLVAFPSFGGNEAPAQEFMAEVLTEAGLEVDLWEIDESELAGHPAYATELERDRPLGVVGSWTAASPGPTLVFNGHVDVVPAGSLDTWATPPFELVERDGLVVGRGVADMKGPVVAAVAGIRAVLAAGAMGRGSLVFHSVIGEEDGGLGTLASVLRGHTGDGAVVVEPTGLDIATAQAGALNFRLEVPGSAAHGALRHEGRSAIEHFGYLYDALLRLEADRNRSVTDPRFSHLEVPFPICVGTVRGGEWASSVAQQVTAEGRLGVPVAESVQAARRALERHVSQACRTHDFLSDHPATVTWWGGQFAPCETDPGETVVRVARDAAASLGVGGVETVGVPYGSDLRLLVREGRTPGVLWGPGEVRRAHRENESISIPELMDGARAAALTAMRFSRS